MGDRLKDMNVLITGSGRGFGQSMAVSYASEGAHVISTSRTWSELRNTEAYIRAVEGRVSTIPCDLSDDESVKALTQAIIDLGGVDIIVNNAATSPWKTIDEMTVEDWDLVQTVNLRAPFLLTKLLYKSIAERGGGSIINISSGSSRFGFMAELAYCPSKFGLEGLTQCLALELRQHGIAVNSLNVSAPPGLRLKPTELTEEEADGMPEEVKVKYATVESMVEKFTDAWVFLALQKGDGITGQRFRTRTLAEDLTGLGEEAVAKRYRGKLLEAVYTQIDFPEKVKYQTPEGGWKEIRFI
ncbi:SDR family oxidoreductase [Candidatus Bathyarchaeota archaeon]|nr:SDR family oxidoreductase [Candidatus Bathyarchaeota archaeon]